MQFGVLDRAEEGAPLGGVEGERAEVAVLGVAHSGGPGNVGDLDAGAAAPTAVRALPPVRTGKNRVGESRGRLSVGQRSSFTTLRMSDEASRGARASARNCSNTQK